MYGVRGWTLAVLVSVLIVKAGSVLYTSKPSPGRSVDRDAREGWQGSAILAEGRDGGVGIDPLLGQRSCVLFHHDIRI